MHKFYIYIFMIVSCTPVLSKCIDADDQNVMAVEIFQNEEFRNYACPLQDCTQNTFVNTLDFMPEVMGKNNQYEMCVVESKIKTKNIYAAIYETDNGPMLQFTHWGKIEFSPRYSGGRKILIARTTLDNYTYREFKLAWKNGRYILQGRISTSRFKD